METVMQLPQYGYVHFTPSLCDYPNSGTPAQILMGNRELIMRIKDHHGDTKEGSFKVIFMIADYRGTLLVEN